MGEFAWSPMETVNSLLPGYTRNPYALDRVPAGSSGGTAAAVAASFGAVGLGTDTGNSIRGPSSHTSLVGIRPTMGLISRGGIVPLFLNRDVGGPMARTVADAAAVLDVITGPDAADPVTASGEGRRPDSYLRALDPDGLKGARVGVLRQLFMEPNTDPEILQATERALADMARQGAVVVDGVGVPELDRSPVPRVFCNRFKHDIEQYLASLGPQAPVKTLAEIVEFGALPPLDRVADAGSAGRAAARRQSSVPRGRRERAAPGRVGAQAHGRTAAGRARVPVVEQPAAADRRSQHARRQHQLAVSPPTGFPAISVPMGFVRGGAPPAGLQILGRPWSEPTLIKIGYAYEQATAHRRPPASTPPLAGAP